MKRGNCFKYSIAVMLTIFVVSCAKTDETVPGTGDDVRDKMVGSWINQETSRFPSNNASYTITISKDVTSSDGLIIKNFYQLGANVSTLANSDGYTIVIPQQEVAGYTIKSLSGTYNSNNTMTIKFTTNDHQNQLQSIDTLTAQIHH